LKSLPFCLRPAAASLGTFDSREDAEILALELGQLLVDTSYREFVMARYESEKKSVTANLGGGEPVFGHRPET
jgi:hypothetical protein